MEQSDNVIVCPVCQHRNPLGTLRCAQCGIALAGSTTTVRIDDEAAEEVVGDLGIAPPAHRYGETEGLVFYVAGEVQPLVVRGRTEVILGRHVEGQTPAEVLDLTPYHGHLLGVSRRHARVRFSAEECLLEDLNSTNGTWLNEKRLTPNTPYIVSNGDQIRLGQMILFVYFSAPSPRQKITLERLAAARAVRPRLTMSALTLSAEAGSYLRALLGLQEVVDAVHMRNHEGHTVHTIHVDGEKEQVEATLSGLGDAVSIAQQAVIPWQKQHADLLATVWTGEAVVVRVAGQTQELGELPTREAEPDEAQAEEDVGPVDAAAEPDDPMAEVESGASAGNSPAEEAPEAPGGEEAASEVESVVASTPETGEVSPAEAPEAGGGKLIAGVTPETISLDEEAAAGETADAADNGPAAEPGAEETIPMTLEVAQEQLLGQVQQLIRVGLLSSEQDLTEDQTEVLRGHITTLSVSSLEITRSSY